MRQLKIDNSFFGFKEGDMGKKLTYDDVLSEAVYSVLEVLRVKHEEMIIEKLKTSDVLTMDAHQLDAMMLIITGDEGYKEMVEKKFLELRRKYLAEGIYDPSGETIQTVQRIEDYTGELNLF